MEEKLRISVEVLGDDPKKLKAALKDLTQEIKAVDLGFKSGALTQQQVAARTEDLTRKIKATSASELQLVDITTRLWRVNNNAEIGFKSLATETVNANRALREINMEQRVGNRLLGSLSGIVGGPAAGVIGQFQQFEDGILSSTVALRGMGSAGSTLATTLVGLAGPLAAIAAIGVGEFMLWENLSSSIEKSANELRKLQGLTEKMESAPFWKRLLASAAGPSNMALSFFGGLAKADIDLANKVYQEKHKIVLDEVVVTGEKEKQKKIVKEIAAVERSTYRSFAGPSYAFSPESPESIEAGLRGVAAQRKRVGGRGFGGVNAQYENEISERIRVAAAIARGEASSTFAQIGQDALTNIGGNLVRAFAMGEQALQSFGQIAQSILGTLISGLFAYLGSLIPGAGGVIVSSLGGVLGGGLSGSAPNIGGSTRGAAPTGAPQIVIRGNFGYDKLSFAVDRGNQMRSLRT